MRHSAATLPTPGSQASLPGATPQAAPHKGPPALAFSIDFRPWLSSFRAMTAGGDAGPLVFDP